MCKIYTLTNFNKYYNILIICNMLKRTVAKRFSCFLSSSSSQVLAKYCSSIVDGGVVMSKNRVNRSRTLKTGSLSCGSHDFTGPFLENHKACLAYIIKFNWDLNLCSS